MQQSLSFTDRQIARRAETLLRTARNVPAGSETIARLGDLTDVLADRPARPVVVARMTARLASGKRLIVEVHEGATFNSFYRIYTQEGARRSTKTLVSSPNRNEGNSTCQPASQWEKPGLDLIAKRWSQRGDVLSTKIRIIKRRAYKRLLTASPDEIGLTQVPYRPLKRSF